MYQMAQGLEETTPTRVGEDIHQVNLIRRGQCKELHMMSLSESRDGAGLQALV